VRWPGPDGKRLAKWFVSDSEAKEWAKSKSEEAGDVGGSFGSISEAERAAVARYRKFLAKYPDSPKPDSLDKIVKDYARRFEDIRKGATVETAVEAFLKAKKGEGRSAGHLATLGVRLGRFVEDHGSRLLPSFDAAEISDYVLNLKGPVLHKAEKPPGKRMRKDGTPVKRTYRPVMERREADLSLETKAGYRRALCSLFEWARKRGMVRMNPVIDADKPTPRPKLPGILAAVDVQAFFNALAQGAPALVPFWAVRAFAGVREAEALRMDWRMIDLAAGKIILPATVTKTRTLREIKIEPALAEFLKPHAKESGPLVDMSPMARRWHLRLALRSVPKLPQPRNWSRHSFATYHLLHFRHAGETAMQLGHSGSPEVLHRHYKGCSTESEAAAFWAIRPETPENVVSMATASEDAEPQAERRVAR
jgi:integrase